MNVWQVRIMGVVASREFKHELHFLIHGTKRQADVGVMKLSYLRLCLDAFRFRLDWQSRFLPSLPPAGECAGLEPTCLLKFLRHTGASILVRSSTVGNKPSRMRKAKPCRFNSCTIRREADGAASLQCTRSVSLLGAHIEQNHWSIPLPELT